MNLLAIDTSCDVPAIGLSTRNGRHVAPVTADGQARRHGRDLLPSIRSLLARAGIGPRDLDVLAVGLGPGSYTGLRIGLTAARTLAYAAGAGILGLDSLEPWARAAPDDAPRIHVVADAQRGDVYAAGWERDSPGSPLRRFAASGLESLAEWSARLRAGDLVLGPAVASPMVRCALPEGILDGPAPDGPRRSGALLEMALVAWREGRRDDLWSLEPNYLRRSAAEDQQDARATASRQGTGSGS